MFLLASIYNVYQNVLDYFNAFEIIADKIDSGAEVYSLIRDSNLEPEKYLDTFFETGNEYGH